MTLAVKDNKKDERYDVSTHFGFGENWADYAQHIDSAKIEKAEEGLFKLIPSDQLEGKTFMDIGCGSGLHSLSALRGGVREAVCVDIDPHSVKTTQAVLGHHWTQPNYRVYEYNILADAPPADIESRTFDIVYSWGVLHHTGDMWAAIEKSASFVAPGGMFVIALYKKSPLCKIWAIEKKLYTNYPLLRWPLNIAYMAMYCVIKLLLLQNPFTYIKEYSEERGMLFLTDVKDWLGGYPYQSATARDVEEKVQAMGFNLDRSYNTEAPKAGGILGSGCAEYVFIKNA